MPRPNLLLPKSFSPLIMVRQPTTSLLLRNESLCMRRQTENHCHRYASRYNEFLLHKAYHLSLRLSIFLARQVLPNIKRQRAPSVSLIERYSELFVFRKRKLLQHEHLMLAILALYLHYLMIGTQGLKHLLLYGSVLCHLLIHHLKRDKIHRIRHISAVFHTRWKYSKPLWAYNPRSRNFMPNCFAPMCLMVRLSF